MEVLHKARGERKREEAPDAGTPRQEVRAQRTWALRLYGYVPCGGRGLVQPLILRINR